MLYYLYNAGNIRKDVMAPVVPFLGVIGAALGAVGTIASAVISSNQADKTAERQLNYQKELNAQQQATEEQEKQLTLESQQRSQAYGASLLDGNTALDNMLSGGYNSDNIGNSESTSLLGNTLQSGSTVQSMFA